MPHALLVLWSARPVPDAPFSRVAFLSPRIVVTAALAARVRTDSVLEAQNRVPEAAARHRDSCRP